MKKIDRRKNYRMVIDVETCPMDRTVNGVSPDNMLVYDIGWAIVDKKGNVYETKSYIVSDIFLGEKELMKSAYYYNKVPKYWEKVKNKQTVIKGFINIRKDLLNDIETYEVTEIYGHNMNFDYNALNNTYRWLTKSKNRYYLPYGIKVCDTMKMASDVFGTMKTYRMFCENNNYMTAHKTPRPQLKAEVLYKFLTRQNDFEEEHQGLDDVMIEKDILTYCLNSHKKMRKGLWDKEYPSVIKAREKENYLAEYGEIMEWLASHSE